MLVPLCPTYLLRWGLTYFLPGLLSNFVPFHL
jgi:hypothetical protein